MTTVLLTGAGGAAVPGLIEKLRSRGYRVLAADMDPYAPGLYLADLGFVIPAGVSSDFLPVMRTICQRESVDVIVPLVDEELLASLELENDGFTVILPNSNFVRICLDKFLLMQNLDEVGISIPRTLLATAELKEIDFPLVVKPRKGRGSRGLGIVNSKEELESFLSLSPYAANELILQEYINGPEFTVSVVVWRDGDVQAVVPKRIISKRGITNLAVTQYDSDIEKLCCEIQKRLRADGPFNVQLRINQNTGKPVLFEINPRFSTTVSLTIAAGINELEGLIIQAVGGKEKFQFGDWKEGVVLLRRYLDLFIDETTFKSSQPIKESKEEKK